VAGDFARVELPGPFEVVYVGGFGEGSEDDQRRLLRRVGSWLEPGGCAIIEVVTPWYWVRARHLEGVPAGQRADGWTFDADACRAYERVPASWDEGDVAVQAVRCYGPADLRLLLEDTGLVLDALEAYPSEEYETVTSLELAKLYLARLVVRS